MNNAVNTWLKGRKDMRGAKYCILFRLLLEFLNPPDCGEEMTVKPSSANKMISIRFTLVVRTFWDAPNKVPCLFQTQVFSASVSHEHWEELGPLWFLFIFLVTFKTTSLSKRKEIELIITDLLLKKRVQDLQRWSVFYDLHISWSGAWVGGEV